MCEIVLIGIDGGGTKTEAVVMDASGDVRGSALASSSNHNSVGVLDASERPSSFCPSPSPGARS